VDISALPSYHNVLNRSSGPACTETTIPAIISNTPAFFMGHLLVAVLPLSGQVAHLLAGRAHWPHGGGTHANGMPGRAEVG
jgi:hypothetical protein